MDREPDRARPLLEEACGIWRKVEPSRPSDRVGSLAGLSWVYRKQGLAGEARRVLEEADEADRRLRKQAAELRDHAEYLKALPLLQESVEIAHILHPDNQIDLAARLIDLGDLLDVLGKYRDSRAQTEQALGILRKVRPRGDRETVRGLLLLVKLHNKMAEYQLAKKYHGEALNTLPQLVGATSWLYFGSTVATLGELAAEFSSYKQAENLLEKSLEVLRKEAPPSAPERLNAVLNLARLHELRGDMEGSAKLMAELGEAVAALPPRHPFRVTFQGEQASIHQASGRPAQAEAACRRAIELAKVALPPGHIEVAFLWNRLGTIGVDIGDMKCAETAFRNATLVLDRNMPLGHPTIALFYQNLGTLYEKVQMHKAAKRLFEEVLKDRREAFPPSHPDIAATLNALGGVHQSLKELDLAETFYREALAIEEKMNGLGAIPVKNNLSTLYADRGDLATSGKLLRETLQMGRRVLSSGPCRSSAPARKPLLVPVPDRAGERSPQDQPGIAPSPSVDPRAIRRIPGGATAIAPGLLATRAPGQLPLGGPRRERDGG